MNLTSSVEVEEEERVVVVEVDELLEKQGGCDL